MKPLPSPADSLRKRLRQYTTQPGGLARLDCDQMSQILRLARKTIEKDGLAQTYPTTKLFADWLQHNELRNPVALQLLERLNRDIGDMGAIALVVPAAIGLNVLRAELIQFFAQYQVADDLLETGSLWLRFGGLLLEEIADVPIIFPKEVGAKGTTLAIRNRIWDHSIETYGDPAPGKPLWFDSLLIEVDEVTDDFMWRLEFDLEDGSRWGARGRLYLTDARPFRVNDLGLRYDTTPEILRRAAEKVAAERRPDSLFLVAPAQPPAEG